MIITGTGGTGKGKGRTIRPSRDQMGRQTRSATVVARSVRATRSSPAELVGREATTRRLSPRSARASSMAPSRRPRPPGALTAGARAVTAAHPGYIIWLGAIGTGPSAQAGGLLVRSVFRVMRAKLEDKVTADEVVLRAGGAVFHASPPSSGPLSPARRTVGPGSYPRRLFPAGVSRATVAAAMLDEAESPASPARSQSRSNDEQTGPDLRRRCSSTDRRSPAMPVRLRYPVQAYPRKRRREAHMVYLGGPRRRRGATGPKAIYLHDPPPGYQPPRMRSAARLRQAHQDWVLVRVATGALVIAAGVFVVTMLVYIATHA